MAELKRILVATNFDDASGAVVEAAASLAQGLGASVYVLCVLEALMYSGPEMTAWAERDPRTHPHVTRQLTDAVHALRASGVEDIDGGLGYGIAGDVILRRASEGRFDLIVVGTHGNQTGVGAYLRARSTVPVIAVSAGARPTV